MTNIPLFKVFMSPNIKGDILEKFLHSGYIGQGKKVDEFEEQLSTYFSNHPYVTTVNSGTSALHLALKLLSRPQRKLVDHPDFGGQTVQYDWPGITPQHDEILASPLTCLSAKSPILLENGKTAPIGKIVNQKLKLNVISYNTETGKLEPKRIINWIKTPLKDSGKTWYWVSFKNNFGSRGFGNQQGTFVTNDHKILTESNTYVSVEILKKEPQKIATRFKTPNKKQQEFINGKMLGDGFITRPLSNSTRFNCTHVHTNKDWVELANNILLEWGSRISEKRPINQSKKAFRCETKKAPFWLEERSRWYNDNKKTIPSDLELTPLTLATWYMDDGALNGNAATLMTDCFSKNEISYLIDEFKKLNIIATPQKAKRGTITRIYIGNGTTSHNSAKKFFKLISPYILPSFRYKLPTNQELPEYDPNLWNLGEAKTYYGIPEIIRRDPPSHEKSKRWAYDIEVEDNHNFISHNTIFKNCTASNVPIALANYKIKWVDINPFTLNMDLDDLERKVSPTTKAIILPYWGGYPTNLDRIAKIQAKAKAMYGFKPALIEDAAHAFGAKYKNKFIGTHGHITMFSLQAIKHITSVDGGVLMLPTPDLYKRSKLLRWYGIDRESPRRDMRCEDPVHEFGTKWHMNDLNALIGSINLQHADEILSKHRANAAYYDEHLNNITGLTQLVYDHEDRQSSYWLYSMHVDKREDFTRYLEEKGIATSRVHERNDLHPDWAQYRTSLPSLEQAMKTYISIPVGWWVTPEQREYIVETIKAGW